MAALLAESRDLRAETAALLSQTRLAEPGKLTDPVTKSSYKTCRPPPAAAANHGQKGRRMSIRNLFQPTILFAFALMAVIVMMILPVPAWVLDLGLAMSFGLAILIFTTDAVHRTPAGFLGLPDGAAGLADAAPVAERLFHQADHRRGAPAAPTAAGGVIEGFAMFVMGGNVVMGLVVFGVLLIVNFIVINKGAARMAEVGARFALDGMPGRQLAIDSDMSRPAPSTTPRPRPGARKNRRRRPFSARSTGPRNSSRAMRSPGC